MSPCAMTGQYGTKFGTLSVDLQKIVRRCEAIMTVLALRGQPWQRRQTHAGHRLPLTAQSINLTIPLPSGFNGGFAKLLLVAPFALHLQKIALLPPTVQQSANRL